MTTNQRRPKTVAIFHKHGSIMFSPYTEGDEVESVFTFDLEPFEVDDPRTVANRAFAAFNGAPSAGWERRMHDYYAVGNRSLSVGDLVVMGEVALSCDRTGWSVVAVPAVER